MSHDLRIIQRVQMRITDTGTASPSWSSWKTLVVALSLGSAFVLYVVYIGIGVWESYQLLTWIVVTSVGGSFIYLSRKKLGNFRFRKTVWIVGGACLFSMPLALGWVYLLNVLATPFVNWLASPSIPFILRLMILGIVMFIPPLACGGFIAERLGKRRDYMPYI